MAPSLGTVSFNCTEFFLVAWHRKTQWGGKMVVSSAWGRCSSSIGLCIAWPWGVELVGPWIGVQQGFIGAELLEAVLDLLYPITSNFRVPVGTSRDNTLANFSVDLSHYQLLEYLFMGCLTRINLWPFFHEIEYLFVTQESKIVCQKKYRVTIFFPTRNLMVP